MLTESKRLNIAIILFAFLFIYGVFWGILYTLLATLMSYHIEAIGMTSSQVRNYNPRLMRFIGELIRLLGTMSIAWSITNLFILYYSFRNKEKWSWIVFLITELIYYIIYLIILYILYGLLSTSFISGFLRTVLLIIALGISYREFFPKSKKTV